MNRPLYGLLVKFPSFLDNPSTLWTVHFMDLTLYGPSTFGWTVHFMDHPSWKFSILLRRTVHFMNLTKFPSFLVEPSTLWTWVKFPSFLDDLLTYGLNKFSILLRWTVHFMDFISYHHSWMNFPLHGLDRFSILLGWTVHFMDFISYHPSWMNRPLDRFSILLGWTVHFID